MLEMTCEKCAVQGTCPKNGSSPAFLLGKQVKCRLVGGYGRLPVDPEILSDESKRLAAQNGPCVTIAEVPYLNDDGAIDFEVIKVFSKPILSDREHTNMPLDSLYARSHTRR
jgi:hypothetical protein